jgi:hypothetical protein
MSKIRRAILGLVIASVAGLASSCAYKDGKFSWSKINKLQWDGESWVLKSDDDDDDD